MKFFKRMFPKKYYITEDDINELKSQFEKVQLLVDSYNFHYTGENSRLINNIVWSSSGLCGYFKGWSKRIMDL